MLSLLRKQDRYGYEISDYLSRHIDIADGTVYPLLRKMKADGLVTSYLQEESGGPPRKYYKLTDGYFEEEIAAGWATRRCWRHSSARTGTPRSGDPAAKR